MNKRRLTTTALIVGTAALVSAGVLVGASIDGEDTIAPIAVPAQATTAPPQSTGQGSPRPAQRPADRQNQRPTQSGPATTQNPAAPATTQPSAGVAVVDGDADVFGDQVRLEAETTQAASRVDFIYGGQTYPAELTETDAEDATKEWGATVPSMAADRSPGETLEFQVRACDTDCAEVEITELVDFDD